MSIGSIEMISFRNHAHTILEFNRGLTVIWGENGSGKTTVLEAIHSLSLGKSFRTSKRRELIKDGSAQLVLSGLFCSNGNDEKVSLLQNQSGERKIKIDDIIFHIPWENGGNVNTDDVNDIFHYTGRLGIEVVSVASSGNKLIINTSITYQLRNNAKWPSSPLRISIIPSANSRLHGQINAQVSILLPVIWTSSSIVSYKVGRNSKIFVGNAQKYTIDNHEIVPVEEEGINELVIKDVYTSSIIIANISQDSIEESSFPQSENTIFNGYKSISSCDLEDNSFLTIDGEPKLDVTIAIPEKDPPWLPLAATALGQKPNSNQPLDDMTGDMRGRIESLIATFNKQYIDNVH